MKSRIRQRAEEDPAFCPICPYCERSRMLMLYSFMWFCRKCGRVHDENILKRIRNPIRMFDFPQRRGEFYLAIPYPVDTQTALANRFRDF